MCRLGRLVSLPLRTRQRQPLYCASITPHIVPFLLHPRDTSTSLCICEVSHRCTALIAQPPVGVSASMQRTPSGTLTSPTSRRARSRGRRAHAVDQSRSKLLRLYARRHQQKEVASDGDRVAWFRSPDRRTADGSGADRQGSGARRGLAIGFFRQQTLARNVWYPFIATDPILQAE
jgi:hypothetical protein